MLGPGRAALVARVQEAICEVASFRWLRRALRPSYSVQWRQELHIRG